VEGGSGVADLSDRRVLIVDDARANVDLLVSALRGEYRLSVALSGEAALRLVEKTPPDLILLDVVMPGLDGFEVCRRLRENRATRDIPVMFLTSLDEVASKTQAFEMGGTDYVTKPFEMLEVKARVRSLLKAKAYNDAFREMVAGELRIAREIQSSALPRDFETLAAGTGLEVHAVMAPAREVGGDLYELLRLPEGRLFAALGDVSGKGIPAAMFMMVATALLRVAAREGLEPPALLARLNEQLCVDNPTSMFVTLTCAAVDGAGGSVCYAIAGHTAPVLVTAGGEARLLAGDLGTITGVESGLVFPAATVTLAPGDALVLYSDGVTEAFDPAGRPFGEARLLAALAGAEPGSARELVERLLATVHAFAAGAEPSDDIAILAVRRAVTGPLQLTVRADRRAVVEATERLRAWCRTAAVPAAATHDLALALEEVGINVTVHALGERPEASFRVRLCRTAAEAVLEVRDAGPAFNPLDVPPPPTADSHADQPLGGLGIHLVRGVMTRTAWARDGQENVITLTRALDG
jgi:sigma-B regulation protein RsbU (phosphoserine phosphatase)